MRGRLVAALGAGAVLLTGCSASSEDVVGDLADAWSERDLDRVGELAGVTFSGAQRDALARAMESCAVDPDSLVDVEGGISPKVRSWGLVADCGGTESLLAGIITTDNDEEAWQLDATYLPGGKAADLVPPNLPPSMRTLPKVGTADA